jgi:hypothetical protein
MARSFFCRFWRPKNKYTAIFDKKTINCFFLLQVSDISRILDLVPDQDFMMMDPENCLLLSLADPKPWICKSKRHLVPVPYPVLLAAFFNHLFFALDGYAK